MSVMNNKNRRYLVLKHLGGSVWSPIHNADLNYLFSGTARRVSSERAKVLADLRRRGFVSKIGHRFWEITKAGLEHLKQQEDS